MHSIRTFLVCTVACILGCRASGDEAVVIAPSEYFEGNDGPWSTFFLRVGTPEQDVRVLVSTASPESIVVFSDVGCSTSVFDEVPKDCAVSRGNLFEPNESSTWEKLGTFGINGDGVGLETNLGYSQRTEFGSETLSLGLTGPSLDNQTVAGIATADHFYLGIFGLNNQPVNFSSLGNYSSPSFLTTLRDQELIPSLSWSYTAGAKYRLKQVYGQLVFSGYDTSRFEENSVSFSMADDLTRDLVVILQSVSYSGSTAATLLSDPIQIFIDSTDANLWLPESVCDAFEEAFGLTAPDADSDGLYIINETHHNALLDADAEVTFRLSDVAGGGETVKIVLPYAAFDLTAEYPLVDNTSYYFPLRRAANETQYTLGRVFLQEAYLSADYERKTFNVSACAWDEGAEENIVTILSKDASLDPPSPDGDDDNSSLSGGAIAGIVIGAVAAAVLIGAAILLIVRRQRKKSEYAVSELKPDPTVMIGPVHNAPAMTPALATKFYSPSTVGDSTGGSRTESNGPIGTNTYPSQQGSNNSRGGTASAIPDADADAELDGDSPQIYQLHGVSKVPGEDNEDGPKRKMPVYHELAGTEIPKADEDQVSTIGTLDNRDEGVDASSDLVSPTTPVHPGIRASLNSDIRE